MQMTACRVPAVCLNWCICHKQAASSLPTASFVMLTGLVDEKAGGMAVAVVSARLRSALIDAAAAYRQGNELEVLNELMRIVGVLDKFPLPPRSPQADMIATAVQQRATLPERQVLESLVLKWHCLFPTSGKV